MNNWQDAAYRYRLADAEEIKKRQAQAYEQAEKELEEFMTSQEGRDARELLKASRKTVVLCEYELDGEKTTVYLSGQSSTCFLAVLRNQSGTEEPKESAWLPKDALRVYVDECGNSPSIFISLLRYQLDLLAAAAPNPFAR